MSDLLPPSPSAANYNSRVFAPSPSALSSSIILSDKSALGSSANASISSVGLSRNHSPPLSNPSHSYFHNTNSSSFNSSGFSNLIGPSIRPLDFGALMTSHDGTHAELAKTVEDLTQWLSIVEVGLSTMLDFTDEDTIAEEQEDQAFISEDAWVDASRSVPIMISNRPVKATALVARS